MTKTIKKREKHKNKDKDNRTQKAENRITEKTETEGRVAAGGSEPPQL